MNEDPKLSQRYRELSREEPPRALDDAILAASRRAVHRRRSWYVPLAAAAAITLAVAVTLHVQHDRPGEEVDAVTPLAKVQEVPQPQEPPRVPARAPAPAAAPAAPAAAEERMGAEQERREVAAASAPARASRDERQRTQAQMARSSIELTPEAELERIVKLRTAGMHQEADKALAEFRRRYPDYRLSEEMKAKVEKRQ